MSNYERHANRDPNFLSGSRAASVDPNSRALAFCSTNECNGVTVLASFGEDLLDE